MWDFFFYRLHKLEACSHCTRFYIFKEAKCGIVNSDPMLFDGESWQNFKWLLNRAIESDCSKLKTSTKHRKWCRLSVTPGRQQSQPSEFGQVKIGQQIGSIWMERWGAKEFFVWIVYIRYTVVVDSCSTLMHVLARVASLPVLDER